MKRFVLPALALALSIPAAAHAQEVQVQGSVQVGTAAPPPPPQQPVAQPVYVQQQQPQQPVYVQQPVYGQPVYQQPAYYPPQRHMRVVPYNGGPIPPGATLRTHRRTGLAIGGAVMFGVPYLISAAIGAACLDSRYGCLPAGWLLVPVVGPIITGVQTNGLALSFGVIDALLQAGGITMFVIGVAVTNQELVMYAQNEQHDREAEARRRRAQWSIVPSAAGANVGLTLNVMHF